MSKTFRLAAAVLAFAAAALPSAGRAQLAGKKILFINSYHEGYEWSDGVEAGAKAVLASTAATLTFLRMDTKRHQDEAFRKQAGLDAKAAIEAQKPDLVIMSDDPAVKYVLVPFFKDAALPFVFCGVNWEASKYGMPSKNATGMVEVALVKELLDNMKDYAKGGRVGFLTVDSETERIELPFLKKAMGINFAQEKMVKTMAEWKDAFAKMQAETDMVLFGNVAGIVDWNEADAVAWAGSHARVITGGTYDFLMPFTMLGFTKVAEEQGQWAARSAIEILQGKPAGSIPIAANKQAKILINPKLAGAAGVVFKPDLVRNAKVAGAK